MNEAPAPPWKAHLRGVLVAAHVIAVGALSTPDMSGALNRKAWKTDTVQHEIGTWAARLEMDPAELEAQAWSVATSWVELRDGLLTPFTPYARYVGVRQRWRMFAAAERVPARLQIEVEEAGRWRTVYVSRDPELRWGARRFDRERMRVLVGSAAWVHRRKLYAELVEWIADEAAHDFPDASRVRVAFLRGPTPTPEQVLAGHAPELKTKRAKVRELGGRR